jgi:vesicle transport through interaction with t-SNAREs 1
MFLFCVCRFGRWTWRQGAYSLALLAKLREYKSDLNNVKSELKRIFAPNARQATREELLESGMADTLAVS